MGRGGRVEPIDDFLHSIGCVSLGGSVEETNSLSQRGRRNKNKLHLIALLFCRPAVILKHPTFWLLMNGGFLEVYGSPKHDTAMTSVSALCEIFVQNRCGM